MWARFWFLVATLVSYKATCKNAIFPPKVRSRHLHTRTSGWAEFNVVTSYDKAECASVDPTSNMNLHNKHGPGYCSRYSDSLRAGRSGDRIPVGARFSAPVQNDPGAYPASCTIGTGSLPGVKRPGRGADHPPPSKCRGHEMVGLYLYSPSGPQGPVIGWTFTYIMNTILGLHVKWHFFHIRST